MTFFKSKTIAVFLALLMLFSALPVVVLAAGDIGINTTNFPDNIFRSYVSSTFDTNKDGRLSSSEISGAIVVDVGEKGISSLGGIEYLTSLRYLYCANNYLTSLDLSKNTELVRVDCQYNNISTLDFSNNTKLETIHCFGNVLVSINVTRCPSLKRLECSNNSLTSLNVSANTKLQELYCHINSLTSLDISKNTELKELFCGNNKLKKLDTSKNTKLTSLYCFANEPSEYIPTTSLPSYDSLRAYIAEQCKSLPETIDISRFSVPNTIEANNALFRMFFRDIPEIFHAQMLMLQGDGKKITTMSVTYSMSASTYNKMLGECEKAAAKLLDGIIGNDSLSEVEKALLLHDRLAVHCEYETTRSQNNIYIICTEFWQTA